MKDIDLKETTRFSVRCAALCIEKGKILIHKKKGDKFYTLPGGKCKLGEDSRRAVERELMEELNFAVKLERLVLIGENFFRFRNIKHHEILFVYMVSKQSARQLMKLISDEQIIGHLIFKWVPINDMKGIKLNPLFVWELIIKEVPAKLLLKLSHVSNH